MTWTLQSLNSRRLAVISATMWFKVGVARRFYWKIHGNLIELFEPNTAAYRAAGHGPNARPDPVGQARDRYSGRHEVTIYHNPNCGTSRNVHGRIRNAGIEPTVIEYLKAPPDRQTLSRSHRARGGSSSRLAPANANTGNCGCGSVLPSAGRRTQQQISSRSTRSRFKASWRRQPRSFCCRGPWFCCARHRAISLSAMARRRWGGMTPPRADTHFRIASNTKTMTAAIIVLLAQEGKLRFDDPVSKMSRAFPMETTSRSVSSLRCEAACTTTPQRRNSREA